MTPLKETRGEPQMVGLFPGVGDQNQTLQDPFKPGAGGVFSTSGVSFSWLRL